MDENRPIREDNDFSQTGKGVFSPPTGVDGPAGYEQMNTIYSGGPTRTSNGYAGPQWQSGPQGPMSIGQQGAASGGYPGGPFQNGYPYPTQNGSQGPVTNVKKKNTAAIVIAAIAAVILLGGVVFAVVHVLKDKEDSGDELETITTVAVEAASGAQTEETLSPAEVQTTQAPEELQTTQAPPALTTAAPPQNATVPTQATTRPVTYPSPVISYATTVSGNVLESSNVSSTRSFGADKLLDGYADTCWCVNTGSQGGVGGAFTIVLRETSLVSGIGIINGNLYQPQDNIYRSNGQLRDFTLTFSDGSSLHFTASYNGTVSNQYEYIAFASPVVTDRITLRVDSAYVGTKYTTNVCVGEIAVY